MITSIYPAINWVNTGISKKGVLLYSFYFPSSPETESKFMKKHRSRTTTLTPHEQTAITYNSFGALQSNKDFWALLTWANKIMISFNHWSLSSLRARRVNKLTDFFQNTQSFFPMYFNALYCIALLCLAFADPLTYFPYSTVYNIRKKICSDKMANQK